MLRAARLDVQLYEEVEQDTSAMGQAMLAVLISSAAAGIGMFSTLGVVGILTSAVGALIGWFVWAFLTYFVGTRFLATPQTKANFSEMLRTLGFASSPGVIRVLGVIPPLRVLVGLAATIWMIVSMVVAVRQTLDYTSTGRAVAVVVIGWLIMVAIIVGLAALMGGLFFGAAQTMRGAS
ncbi:MAG: YIP1 family protein [Candidatus Omnitrophica bacterium]|nr:YIP1 family protein [Candidatus Omnitrophota bacterium]